MRTGSIPQLIKIGIAHHQAGRLNQAESIYQSILKEQPGHPDALHLLGVIAHQVGKSEIAVDLIEKAIRKDPAVPDFYNNCGEAYRALHDIDSAITHYEQALAINPDYAEAHYNSGIALEELGRHEEAVGHYERALTIKPDYAEAHNNFGVVLKVLGRHQEAIAHFEQALAIKPDYADAYGNLTLIKPKRGQVSVIEKLLTGTSVSEKDTMLYHYALGNILDDTRSYSRAFQHYLKANALRRRTSTFDSQRHSLLVDRLMAVFSKSFFQGKTAYGSDSELPVFIVGMPRSGTTLVEQIVSSHPQVHGAGELASLGRTEKAITKQFETSDPYPECMPLCTDSVALEYSMGYVEELANHSRSADRITDKMPSNFLRIGVIKTLFPRARIIHCQRNALDICTSIFLSYFVRGNEYSFDLTDIGSYYLDYERLMAHWSSVFSSQIFDVQYEELVMNQESISRQLIEYLGLEWDERCLDFHKNKRAVQTASNLQVRKPIYDSSIDRWKHYEKHLDPLIAILSGDVP